MLILPAILAALTFAFAEEPAPLTNPTWSQAPIPSYPSEAAAMGIDQGEVVLNCAFRPEGGLADCQVVSETPVGAGFGPAAVSAASMAKVSPATTARAVPGQRLNFKIRFRLA